MGTSPPNIGNDNNILHQELIGRDIYGEVHRVRSLRRLSALNMLSTLDAR
jgi:hypothetical protein